MNKDPTWDMQQTHNLILDLYGKEQFVLAKQSLNSVIERRDFARFHFFEAMNRWDAHLLDIEKCHPIEAIFGSGDDEADERRALRMHEVAAHVHACVHSLHTIPDIMAHGIYYALALNQSRPLDERNVSAKNVAKLIGTDTTVADLYDLFRKLYAAGEFKYVEALNNHGKHRSIVHASVRADMTGTEEKPISLEFSEFTYDQVNHTRRGIRSVLVAEYERISRSIVDCGIALYEILSERKQANS